MIRSVGTMLDHVMPLVSSPWLYLIVFAAVLVDGFLPVMPSETVVIGLGALSASGRPNLVALAAAVVAGGMAGDRVSYWLGRKAGARMRNGKLAVARARAEQALMRYGGAAVVAGRFLPYGRTASTMASGSVGLRRFRLFSGLASVAWAAYAIGLGRLGGAAFAGRPLLGVAFGLALGTVLAGVHTVVERRRGRDKTLRPVSEPRRADHGPAVSDVRASAPKVWAIQPR